MTKPPLHTSDAEGPPTQEGKRDAERAATAKFTSDFMALNKDQLTREAFAGMIVAVLRSALSESAQSSGTREISEFLELLGSGPSVTLHDLVEAAHERLAAVRSRPFALDEITDHLLQVARAGLAYLIEEGANDGAARGRASRRRDTLDAAIERYIVVRDEARNLRWKARGSDPGS